MLTIRRLTAFAIDLVIASALALVLLIGARFLDIETHGTTLFLMLLCVLRIVECVRHQTPGKFVTGIVVRRSDGRDLGAYEVVCRFAVIATTIASALCVLDLLRINAIARSHYGSLAAVVTTIVTTIWPLSILVGRGAIGLHDLAAQTYVSRVGERHQRAKISPRVLLMAIPLTAVTAIVVGVVTGQAQQVTKQFGFDDPQKIEAFMSLRDSLEQVQGHEELVRGFGFTLGPWTPADAQEFAFNDNVDGIGTTFAFNERSFRTIVNFEINTTVEGLTSGDFQRSVARRVATDMLAPGVLLNINFIVAEEVGPFEFMLAKRVVAFGFVTSESEQPLIAIAEPDKDMTIGTGVIIGGLQRDDDG